MNNRSTLTSTDELDFIARYYGLGETGGRWHYRGDWWQIETDQSGFGLWFHGHKPKITPLAVTQ